MSSLVVSVVILAVVLLYAVLVFNRFVKLKNRADEAWSGIDVQLKRRRDLIPNLVTVVKGYAAHEKSTLEEVVKLRNVRGASVPEAAESEKKLGADLQRLMLLAEQYPDLKADKNFRELQATLSALEDDLQYARRYYNGTVRDINILADSFPSNLVARAGGFTKRVFFELEYATERKTPDIRF